MIVTADTNKKYPIIMWAILVFGEIGGQKYDGAGARVGS